MTTFRAELDVNRVRTHFDFARSGRIVTNNAATTQPPRQLLDLYRSLVALLRQRAPRAVHRLAAHHRTVRGVLRHHRLVVERAEPAQHRHLSQHHRGDQRGDVFAAH